MFAIDVVSRTPLFLVSLVFDAKHCSSSDPRGTQRIFPESASGGFSFSTPGGVGGRAVHESRHDLRGVGGFAFWSLKSISFQGDSLIGCWVVKGSEKSS